MNIETANRLLQYRKEHNLSQEELAAKIGVSRQAVSKWERAEASPDTDNLILLAELYGVSLDELLKGETSDNSDSCENENFEKVEHVSFKNGIHVNSRSGDKVNISFKEGINVHEKDGNKVHVGLDGIHVEENGKTRVYTDKDGNIMADPEISAHRKKSPAHKAWLHFPFWAIALAGFLAWGFSGVMFGWSLSWTCFLLIPIYYSLVDAVFKKNPSHFAFPVLTVILYVFFGYFKICGGWAFGWIVFLAIPVYYCICSAFSKEDAEQS